MVEFLFGRMFFLDLLLTGFVATGRFPKRNRFPLRVAVVILLEMGFSYLWSQLLSDFGNEQMAPMLISYFVSFAAVMAGIVFCVKLEKWKLLYMGTTIWFLQRVGDCLDSVLFSGSVNSDMTLVSFLRHMALIALCALAAWLVFLRKLDYHTLDRVNLARVGPILVAMLLMCLVLHSYAAVSEEDTTAYYWADFLCNLVGLLYQWSIYQLSGMEREKDGIQQLLRQSEEQYEAARCNAEQINIKCHDLRHLVQAFRQEQRIDSEALQEIEEAIDAYGTSVHTGNAALDVVLSEKSAQCSCKGIDFTCMAEGEGLSYIKPMDLYVLFSNAIENAMEATERLRDAEKRQISLAIRRVNQFYSVHLQNYTDDELHFVDGLPLTAKPDRQNHGFGVKSMRLMIEKYEGEMQIQQDGDIVDLCFLLPCRTD